MVSNLGAVNMMRWTISLFAGFGLLASPAAAGDRASANFIGFSPEAQHFAFEEYGIESDSGVAYSNIYLVDLGADPAQEITRISSVAEEGDNSEDLAAVRADARDKARPLIAERNIFVPAEIAALNGDGELIEDSSRISVNYPLPAWGTRTKTYSFQVTAFPTSSSAECDLQGDGQPQGYELRIASGLAESTLYRDDGILPVARGCPQSYGAYAVVVPGVGSTKERAVVIISYYPSSFEGPSRRFLAVPFTP